MYFRCRWTKSLIGSLDLLPYMMTSVCMAKDTTEHDNNLLQLMKTAQQQGLVFNSSKCAIRQSQISFYSTIFTAQGVRPDPAKVQALQDLPAPQNSKLPQSFFRPHQLPTALSPWPSFQDTFLRHQVTNWDWNPSTDQAFHFLKSWMCNTLLRITLAYYDHTQPPILQTNVSEYGLSATLLQNNRPIAFTSKTLTGVETRYANIENASTCALDLKSSIHMHMANMSLYKMTTSLWR